MELLEEQIVLKLKIVESLNREILGLHNYKVLVIGGGTPELYGEFFYTVGYHPTANFGAGLDWENEEFWLSFKKNLHDYKFKCIIIDNGSDSWLPKESKIVNQMTDVLYKSLASNGVIIIEGFDIRTGHQRYSNIVNNLKNKNMQTIGSFVLTNSPGYIDYILCKSDIKLITDTVLEDNISGIYVGEQIMGALDPSGNYIEYIPGFEFVPEEDQINFVKNRIL